MNTNQVCTRFDKFKNDVGNSRVVTAVLERYDNAAILVSVLHHTEQFLFKNHSVFLNLFIFLFYFLNILFG